jgi:hypothetical protein
MRVWVPPFRCWHRTSTLFLSRRQDMWQGQRHSSKQRMSIYSLVSSIGNCLWCHVDSDLMSAPCHGTDVSPKDEKRPQGRTTEPQKSSQGQSTSKHKSLDSGRGKPKAMGSHTTSPPRYVEAWAQRLTMFWPWQIWKLATRTLWIDWPCIMLKAISGYFSRSSRRGLTRKRESRSKGPMTCENKECNHVFEYSTSVENHGSEIYTYLEPQSGCWILEEWYYLIFYVRWFGDDVMYNLHSSSLHVFHSGLIPLSRNVNRVKTYGQVPQKACSMRFPNSGTMIITKIYKAALPPYSSLGSLLSPSKCTVFIFCP